jgi:membrane-bound serine protease (ClpP class)
VELAIFLFVLGIFLVLLETIIPSFGLLALTSLGTFALSVWRAYEASGPAAAWIMGILAPLLAAVVLYAGLKYVPRTSWGRGLVLRNPAEEARSLPPTVSESVTLPPQGGTDEEALAPLVGLDGVAQSALRPAGIVLVGGRRVDCVTEGPLIDPGARVRVVMVEGNRVVVRPVRV